MTDGQYRLRVKHGAGEFEIEGSEDFVEKHRDELLLLLREVPPVEEKEGTHPSSEARSPNTGGTGSTPSSFGEYRSTFPELTHANELLIAANFVQEQKGDSEFTYQEASELVQLHGVKVSNPKQVIERHMKRKEKLVFPFGQGSYKVSNNGKKYINGLRENE